MTQNTQSGPTGEFDPKRLVGEAVDAVKTFDFREYFYLIAKRLWLLLLCFGVSIGLMLVFMARQEPLYQASTRLLFSQPVGLPANLQQRESFWGDYLNTQRQLILNRSVIAKAKEKLGIPPGEFNRRYRDISVQPIWQTSIMIITVKGTEPAFCADYANAVSEAFVEYKSEERSDSSQSTVINLSEQAERLAAELSRMEGDLLSYVKDNNVVGIEERGNVAATLLGRLSQQSAEFRTHRMLLEAQQPLLAQASDEAVLATLGYGMVLPEMSAPAGENADAESLIEHGVVERTGWHDLKRENAMLEARLIAARKKFKDAHPQVQEILHKLQENEEALNVETQFALKQYYSQLEALTIKEQAAKRVEQAWEAEAIAIDRKQKEYDGLMRNLRRSQGLYDLIFNRLQEIDISTGIQQEWVRIIEPAVPPSNPSNPQNMQTLFLAALIGLGVGVGLILLIEFMDDSIRFPEEATRILGIPFLGLIPTANWPKENASSYLIHHIDAGSGFAEAYRNVRSAILLNPVGSKFASLAVTSAVPQEGKTTTSVNLAICFAQAGKRVLLVDADLHRGELHKQFGINAGWGLSDILEGKRKMADVTQQLPVEGLSFIGTGNFPTNPAELVMSPMMRGFLAEAEGQYDLVILDAPPVMAVSESTVLASLADAALMVVWGGRTSRKLIHAAFKQLVARGANVIGVVLNNMDLSRLSNYGYSSYYQYYGYDYRYASNQRAASGVPSSSPPDASHEKT